MSESSSCLLPCAPRIRLPVVSPAREFATLTFERRKFVSTSTSHQHPEVACFVLLEERECDAIMIHHCRGRGPGSSILNGNRMTLVLLLRFLVTAWSFTTHSIVPCRLDTSRSLQTNHLPTIPPIIRTSLGMANGDSGIPEPLAIEGDWSAYLDDQSTGLVYYFNSR